MSIFEMNIQPINQYQQMQAAFKAAKSKPAAGAPVFSIPKDSVKVTSKKPEIRESLVNSVKKKITTGFYDSPSVLEELGNSFAKAMNQA